MNNKKIYQIYQIFRKINPNPTTELIYKTPFELLIAVILSAQATDKAVNKVTRSLFAQSNTPQKIIALGEEELSKQIKTIGLYRTKSKNIIKACNQLIKNYNGQIPEKRSELESLSGVGRKTANVVLNTAFGHSTIAVDTHIFRVANRTKIAQGKNVHLVEKELIRCTPVEFQKNAHHWLLLHGRYFCQAKKIKCNECPISIFCEYENKNLNNSEEPLELNFNLNLAL